MIIEYCMRTEAIIHLCVKEGEEENQNCRMRKHFRQWPDDTFRVEKGLSKNILKFQKQLISLKKFHCLSKNFPTVKYSKIQ